MTGTPPLRMALLFALTLGAAGLTASLLTRGAGVSRGQGRPAPAGEAPDAASSEAQAPQVPRVEADVEAPAGRAEAARASGDAPAGVTRSGAPEAPAPARAAGGGVPDRPVGRSPIASPADASAMAASREGMAKVAAVASPPIGRPLAVRRGRVVEGEGVVTGRVVRILGDADGVPGARVSASRNPKDVRATETDERGMFTLSLEAGVRTLLVDAGRLGRVVARCEITPEIALDLCDVALQAPGRIEGIVRGPSAAPLAGVRVQANVAEGEKYIAETGPDGRFALEGLPADTYFIRFESEPAANVGVVVRPGETVRLTLGGVPQVTGVHRNADGAPWHDRNLVVVSASIGATGGPEAGADVLRAFAEAQGRDVVPDALGRFEIGGLAAGRYLVGTAACYEEVQVAAVPEGVVEGEATFTPVHVELRPGVVQAVFAPAPGEAEIPEGMGLRAIREEMLLAGLAGDGRALLLSTLSEDARDRAPPGGAACLVPQAGRYLLLPRGDLVATAAVYVSIERGGRASAVLPVARATTTLRLLGFPIDRITLVAVREEASGRVVAVETFTKDRALKLAPGRYRLDVVDPVLGLKATSVELSPATPDAGIARAGLFGER